MEAPGKQLQSRLLFLHARSAVETAALDRGQVHEQTCDFETRPAPSSVLQINCASLHRPRSRNLVASRIPVSCPTERDRSRQDRHQQRNAHQRKRLRRALNEQEIRRLASAQVRPELSLRRAGKGASRRLPYVRHRRRGFRRALERRVFAKKPFPPAPSAGHSDERTEL